MLRFEVAVILKSQRTLNSHGSTGRVQGCIFGGLGGGNVHHELVGVRRMAGHQGMHAAGVSVHFCKVVTFWWTLGLPRRPW
jgi:hypothetical protein